MNFPIIYKIENTVNGKVYIGQTRQSLARRKGEHIYRANLGEREHKLYRAIRECGCNMTYDKGYVLLKKSNDYPEREYA